jgi:hypothetical protein
MTRSPRETEAHSRLVHRARDFQLAERTHYRKEVKPIMKYEKPEIVVMSSAFRAIRCTGAKNGEISDHECDLPSGHTSAAYEVDE